jgi:hypothetical protein
VVYSAARDDLTAESLERTAQEIKREVEARREVHHQEAIALLLREAREFYAARPMHLLVSSRDDSMIDGLAHACQMISDCARMVSKPGAFKISKVEYMDAVVAQPPRKPINVFDAVKASARQARIARNEQDGVALGGRYIRATPENLRRWRRESQELVLARAIERTQLPHETTIHERIMPYRVKED